MNKRFLPAVATLLIFLLTFAHSVIGMAQSTNRRIPTAPQVAMQKKAKGKRGVMRGTTNTIAGRRRSNTPTGVLPRSGTARRG